MKEARLKLVGEQHGGLEDFGPMVRVEAADGVAQGFEQVAAFVADHLEGLDDRMSKVAVGGCIGAGGFGREVLEDLARFVMRSPVMGREVSDGGGGFGSDLDRAVVQGDGGEVCKARVEAALHNLNAVQARLGFRMARGDAQSTEEVCGVGDDIGLRCSSKLVEERWNGFEAFVGAVCEQDAEKAALPVLGDVRQCVDDGLVRGNVPAGEEELVDVESYIHCAPHLVGR